MLIPLSLDNSEFSQALSHALLTRILVIWRFINETVEVQVKKFAKILKVGSDGILTQRDRANDQIQLF